MRTLAVLPNWVGDTVMALPTLDALAAEGRTVSALCRPHLATLLQQIPTIAEVVPHLDTDTQTIDRLKQGSYAEAVVLPNSFRSAWISFAAGIPRRWGYRDRTLQGMVRSLLLRPAITKPRVRGRHQVEDYAVLLEAMGIAAAADWQPRLRPTEESRALGRELLQRARLAPAGSGLVGLFAGAEFGPSKRWPWRRFAELAQQLRRRLPGARLVILAGPKEVWQAVRIHEESGKIHPVIGPDLDLAALAAVLAALDLLITNDSGPMHLAAALGVSCVALFGPTDPQRTRPYGDHHQVLYTDRWCSPCFRRRCPLIHHRCLRDISVEEVAERCLLSLAAPSNDREKGRA